MNKKPEPVKQKPIIKQHIKTFFEMFNTGDQMRTDDVVKYVRRMTGRQFYPDTILRYARELREDHVINYTAVVKMDRIIRVINPGDSHSL